MKATIRISISPREAVPREGRVEWLEKHGVQPYTATVAATAELSCWSQIAEILSDGDIAAPHAIVERLRTAAMKIVAESGVVPSELPEDVVEAEIARLAEAKEAEKRAQEAVVAAWIALPDGDFAESYREFANTDATKMEHGSLDPIYPYRQSGLLKYRIDTAQAASHQHRILIERAQAATEEAARVAATLERHAWIEKHGSERLRLALSLDLESTIRSSYEEERLALEMPGWRDELEEEDCGAIREPTLAALTALAAERESNPGVEIGLVWLRSKDGGCEALAAEHLNNPVVREVEGGRKVTRSKEEDNWG